MTPANEGAAPICNYRKYLAQQVHQFGEVGGEVSIRSLQLSSSIRNRDITAEAHC
jgi:hypothetical protein